MNVQPTLLARGQVAMPYYHENQHAIPTLHRLENNSHGTVHMSDYLMGAIQPPARVPFISRRHSRVRVLKKTRHWQAGTHARHHQHASISFSRTSQALGYNNYSRGVYPKPGRKNF